ncbi:MAG: ABC transporter permease [Pararhodobacter sp.]|nr:ABC transporter permease [Pararhodobacter sp.]
MYGFIFRRLLSALPVVFIIAVIAFLLVHLAPGDPAVAIAGDGASDDQIAAIRRSLGLDQPLPVQFVTWLTSLVQGDFGTSMISRIPVSQLILQRTEPTVVLALYAMTITLLVAVPVGVLAAWKSGEWVDRLVLAMSVIGFSMPVFVIGYLLIGAFGTNLRWFAVQGYKSPGDGLIPFLYTMTLPAITLSTTYIALIARMTRASMIEILGEDFIRTARAKGLQERQVLFGHALRNAAVPIITVIGSGFAMMISGVVITESVFNIPGIGRLVVDAVLGRDYPLIQALIVLTGVLYVAINLLIDIAYAITDPRIRYS